LDGAADQAAYNGSYPDNDQPLGLRSGATRLEVMEVFQTYADAGPPILPACSLELAARMIFLAKCRHARRSARGGAAKTTGCPLPQVQRSDRSSGRQLPSSGSLRTFAQRHRRTRDCFAPRGIVAPSRRGYRLGASRIGAGRNTKEDDMNPAVGRHPGSKRSATRWKPAPFVPRLIHPRHHVEESSEESKTLPNFRATSEERELILEVVS